MTKKKKQTNEKRTSVVEGYLQKSANRIITLLHI